MLISLSFHFLYLEEESTYVNLQCELLLKTENSFIHFFVDSPTMTTTTLQLLTELLDLFPATTSSLTDEAQEALFDAASNLVVGLDRDAVTSIDGLRDLVRREIALHEWWSQAQRLHGEEQVTSGVETLAACLIESHANSEIEGDETEVVLDDGIKEVLGDERVALGQDFVEWFESTVGTYRVENGHARLAKRLNESSVFHVVRSNDPGLCEMVWEKVGRTWDWIVSRGFQRAGRELIALKRQRIGRILLQHCHQSEEEVALRMALYGGEEMAAEVRDVLGVEPYGGGWFDDARALGVDGRRSTQYTIYDPVPLKSGGPESAIIRVTVLADGRVITGGRLGELVWWDPPARGEEGSIVATERPHTPLPRHSRACRTVNNLMAVGDTFLWTLHAERFLRVWKGVEGEPPVQRAKLHSWVHAMRVMPDQRTVVILDSVSLTAWDVVTNEVVCEIRESSGGQCDGRSLQVLDETRVVMGMTNGRVFICDVFKSRVENVIKVKQGEEVSEMLVIGGNVILALVQEVGLVEVDIDSGEVSLHRSEGKSPEDFSQLYQEIGNGQVVADRRSGQLEIYNTRQRETEAVIRGVDARGVSDTAWDPKRRLLIVVLAEESCWVAYQL